MKKFIGILLLMLSQGLYGAPKSSICVNAPAGDTLRVLGIGNSWTRDSMRWLSAIGKSAGKAVVVGHAYLGGSTLEEQWNGLQDTTYTYRHSGKDQKVHSTYQYWKYNASVNPVKTPSEGYRNGLAGIGVSLEDAVKDEPWDWIVFQPEATFGGDWPRHLGKGTDGYSLQTFIDDVKRMMAPETADRVKVALMVPFSYPQGNTDYRVRFVAVYNGGRVPKDQAEWDRLYRKQYQQIQKAGEVVCRKLSLLRINVGKAIETCRHDAELSACGYLLQRRQDNTHLAEGLPMYIASLCYAYCLLGIGPEDISFFPEDASDRMITGDRGGTLQDGFVLTADLASKARRMVFGAVQ